jgi:hypothetical protein
MYGGFMSVKGRFHKLDEEKKKDIEERGRRLLHIERPARVSEKVNLRNILKED